MALNASGRLAEMLDILRLSPKLMRKADFMRQLSTTLGANHQVDLAISVTKRILKKNPRDWASKLNLAVMYSQRGDQGESDSVLLEIPEFFLESETAYANLIWERGEESKAISLFEKIARGKKGFYLSFVNLARRLPLGSEQRKYWIAEGIKRHPNSFELHQLRAEDAIISGDLELFNDEIPTNLYAGEVAGVIGTADEREREFVCFRTLYAYGQALVRGALDDALEILEEGFPTPGLSKCELIKPLIGAETLAGSYWEVLTHKDMLCHDCRASHPSERLSVEAFFVKNQDSGLVNLSELEAFTHHIQDPHATLDLVSRLDDIGLTKKAIDILTSRQFFDHADEVGVRLRALWDSWFMASRTGNHVLALRAMRAVNEFKHEEMLSALEDVPASFAFSWRHANYIYSLCAVKMVDESERVLEDALSSEVVEVADEMMGEQLDNEDKVSPVGYRFDRDRRVACEKIRQLSLSGCDCIVGRSDAGVGWTRDLIETTFVCRSIQTPSVEAMSVCRRKSRASSSITSAVEV